MAIAFVTSATAGASSGTTIQVTISPAAGDIVVLSIANVTTTTTVTGVSDSVGLTRWNKEQTQNQSTNIRSEMWWGRIVGAPTSITVTFSATLTNAAVVAAEYSGVAADGVSNSNSGTGSTTIVSGLTATDNTNFRVQCGASKGSGTYTSGSGSTLRNSIVQGAAVGAEISDRATSGNVNCTISISQPWADCCMELRSVSPAGVIDEIDAEANWPGAQLNCPAAFAEYEDRAALIILPPVTITQPWDTDSDQQQAQAASATDDLADSAVELIMLPPAPWVAELEAQIQQAALQGLPSDQGQDWTYLIILPAQVITQPWDTDADQQQTGAALAIDAKEFRDRSNLIVLPPGPWMGEVEAQLQQAAPIIDAEEFRDRSNLIILPPVPWLGEPEAQLQQAMNAIDAEEFRDRSSLIILPFQVPKTPWDTDADEQQAHAAWPQDAQEFREWINLVLPSLLPQVLAALAARRTPQLAALGGRSVHQLVALAGRVVPQQIPLSGRMIV